MSPAYHGYAGLYEHQGCATLDMGHAHTLQHRSRALAQKKHRCGNRVSYKEDVLHALFTRLSLLRGCGGWRRSPGLKTLSCPPHTRHTRTVASSAPVHPPAPPPH